MFCIVVSPYSALFSPSVYLFAVCLSVLCALSTVLLAVQINIEKGSLVCELHYGVFVKSCDMITVVGV